MCLCVLSTLMGGWSCMCDKTALRRGVCCGRYLRPAVVVCGGTRMVSGPTNGEKKPTLSKHRVHARGASTWGNFTRFQKRPNHPLSPPTAVTGAFATCTDFIAFFETEHTPICRSTRKIFFKPLRCFFFFSAKHKNKHTMIRVQLDTVLAPQSSTWRASNGMSGACFCSIGRRGRLFPCTPVAH